jgi:integrase
LIMDMPRQRPPHLQRELTRHGRAVWYVRVGKGPRVRLRAVYGSPEFTVEYEAAVAGEPIERTCPANGTMLWLLERYRETTAWLDLSIATRRQRENIFKHVMDGAGLEPFKSVSRKHIVAGRDRRKDTPAQARNFLDAMRGLFRWALEADHVKADPTAGVKNPKRKKGPGFPKWTELEVEQYEARWPVGTRQRVWMAVLLYSGLRRGDAVLLGRQHARDGAHTLRTEKSGETITVTLPILPALADVLEAGPTGDLAYICGERGRPLTKEAFGNMFSKAARAAGVQKSAHGLRKVGATRAAQNGATVAELEAIFGWTGGGMAALYTREADRARLSARAMSKLENTSETSTPAPSNPVRAGGGKPQ